MIDIKIFTFNSFQVNTYLLSDSTSDCIIIDPACYEPAEKEELSAYIAEHSLNPALHLNTHCHIDHVLGLFHVKKRYDVPFWAHEGEDRLLEKGHIMGQVFGLDSDPLPLPDKHITEGEIIRFGNSELKALHVPGHSEGSLAFYSAECGFVITGDALFAGSIGRTDLPGGNYDLLIESIRDKLFRLPDETTVYPGHGEHSTIGKEKSSNPFFG